MTPRPDDDELLPDEIVPSAPQTASAETAPAAGDGASSWHVLVVDDDADVLMMTRLALRGLVVDGIPIVPVVASSAAEGRRILSERPGDFAVAFIDVVMESEHAGLEFLRWIRANVADPGLRLVLRTGQPGTAPEGGIVGGYDIHDYLAKTDTTARRLVTCVTGAVRACRDIRTIREQRASLQAALGAVSGLFLAGPEAGEVPSEAELVRGIAEQLRGLFVARAPRVSVVLERGAERIAVVGELAEFPAVPTDIPPRSARVFHGVLVYVFDAGHPTRFVLTLACATFHPWDVQLVELFCHAASMALRNRNLHQERIDWIRTLERFVPRQLSGMLAGGDLRALVPGDSIVRDMTVCFVDVRGFSLRTAAIGGEAAFRLLNGLFASLAEVIAEHGGIIDKYLGDGMLVLFPPEPEVALAAATQLQRVVKAAASGDADPLEVGIGLHAGEVVVGAVGHRDRIDVSVVSAVVNMAARVQDMTRQLDCGILLTDDVVARLTPQVRDGLRPLLVHELRGDDRARVLWEAFGQLDLPEQARRAAATETLTRATFAAAEGSWGAARELLDGLSDPDATVTALRARLGRA